MKFPDCTTFAFFILIIMTDRFEIIPFKELTEIVLRQLNRKATIFNIPKELFFQPTTDDPFRTRRFGKLLETPLGVAAGPHTQMAQNIVAAWLTGARFIELKTVQTLDELEVSKPCIDMQDEGYNCEWSQELKIHQSFEQYLNAWILIHILKHELGHDETEPGVIFNMSVGYDYEGIMKENVQWFFNKMQDASEELAQKINEIKEIYPAITDIKISSVLSDNITLSTMHGCPPDEIEKIGHYLINKKELHTTIKLNPTLLGKDKLHAILANSGFNTIVPDVAFEHDLTFPDAVNIITNLQQSAGEKGVFFGLKLTNTLESRNNKNIFDPTEEMMYMSGRALHPISVNLAAKIQNHFNGSLDISFSGGADAFNTPELIACGLSPVTVCSDILKPGGYGRLHQYMDELRKAFDKIKAGSTDDFLAKKSGRPDADANEQLLENLNRYAESTINSSKYKKTTLHTPNIKTARPLGAFDCVHAPCVDTCPTNQDIPDYMYHTAHGDFEKAFDVIMRTNPFPNTTGMVCDHQCTTKCTRINYDSPLLIREIKRFVAEYAVEQGYQYLPVHEKNRGKIAIIGAGPSGLSCAWFMAQAGFEVDIYEAKARPGGMVSGAIPSFRLTDEAIDVDSNRIEALGVHIHFNTPVDKDKFETLRSENRFVYLAAGAQKSRKLNIEGCDAKGVLDPLDFLFDVKENHLVNLGNRIAIIGGGNTAMDAARTAYRLVEDDGKVVILYRRSLLDMPADQGEISAVLEEGMEIMEFVSPVKINTRNGHVYSLTCIRMKPGAKDESGRSRPEPIDGSEFDLEFDTIIPAVGQDPAIDVANPKMLKTKPGSYETQLNNVFVGGDALRGASTAINAIGDGRKAANEMIAKANLHKLTINKPERASVSLTDHTVKRAIKTQPLQVTETPLTDRKNFKQVTKTLSKEEAMQEASRCLLCDEVCNVCTTVCPNTAFHSYQTTPRSYPVWKITSDNGKAVISKEEDFTIEQKQQILHLADWCNECGNCATFCPTAGKPYMDKPHLYFTRESYDANRDGYFWNREEGILEANKAGNICSLKETSSHFIFKMEKVTLEIEKNSFEISSLQINEKGTFEILLKEAVEMCIIFDGVKSFWDE
jgi:putative selenate reductase